MHTDVTYCILFLGFRSQICLARVIDCDEPIRNRSLQYIKSGPNPKESSWTLGNMHQEHLQGEKETILKHANTFTIQPALLLPMRQKRHGMVA